MHNKHRPQLPVTILCCVFYHSPPRCILSSSLPRLTPTFVLWDLQGVFRIQWTMPPQSWTSVMSLSRVIHCTMHPQSLISLLSLSRQAHPLPWNPVCPAAMSPILQLLLCPCLPPSGVRDVSSIVFGVTANYRVHVSSRVQFISLKQVLARVQ